MERTKAFRRSCEKKAKDKARHTLIGAEMDEKEIGKLAHCHCRPCSCSMCGNPRKVSGERTLQERKSDLDMVEEE